MRNPQAILYIFFAVYSITIESLTYRRHVAGVVVRPAEPDRVRRIGIHLAFNQNRVQADGSNGCLLGARLTAWRDCKEMRSKWGREWEWAASFINIYSSVRVRNRNGDLLGGSRKFPF